PTTTRRTLRAAGRTAGQPPPPCQPPQHPARRRTDRQSRHGQRREGLRPAGAAEPRAEDDAAAGDARAGAGARRRSPHRPQRRPGDCRRCGGAVARGGDMRFIVAMAWREGRASWRRLMLFFLCIALGVGATVSLRSFTRVFWGSLARDSRMLLSADVRIESSEAWTAEQGDIFARQSASYGVTGQTRLLETQTVARAANDSEARPVLVELKGIEAGFP